MQDVTDDLTESERHLLAELRRANDQVEQQVQERTRALSEKNRQLEAELRELKAQVARLSAQQVAGG